MTPSESFNGDKKFGSSILTRVEKPLQAYLAKRVPLSIETYHLTLLTIPWSALVILSGYLAQSDVRWLWLGSLAIFLQYITDLIDGEIGRQRSTGLIKWGYYMDHFLDFIFLCAMLIGYFFLLPAQYVYLHFFLLSIFGAFMVNSFLAFSVLNRFQIAYCGIGPTEIRIGFIVTNTLIILVGSTHLVVFMPYWLGLCFLGLCFTVYRTQRQIWEVDMKKKNRE